MMATSVRIRWMIRSDMPSVLAIESDSFPDPWTESEFIDHLRDRNVIGMVAVEEYGESEQIVGYVIYRLNKKFLEIINLAVAKDKRREGVGRSILDKLKIKLHPERRTILKAIVTDENLGAHLFFRECGLVATQVKRDHFADGSDGYSFRFSVPKENFCDSEQ